MSTTVVVVVVVLLIVLHCENKLSLSLIMCVTQVTTKTLNKKRIFSITSLHHQVWVIQIYTGMAQHTVYSTWYIICNILTNIW